MKYLTFYRRLLNLGLLVVLCSQVMPSHAQDLVQIREQCRNVTLEQRQLAQQAGYDVDSFCQSLQGIGPSRAIDNVQSQQAVIGERQSRGSSVRNENYLDGLAFGDDDEGETGTIKLKPFGYDLFAGEPSSFAPADQVPLPTNYLLGLGDTLEVLLYGKSNAFYELTINRNGFVDFPQLGPIQLTGLTFSEAKELLQTRIAKQMIGVEASISLGELRSIQIFVLGESYKPGSYVISALSTITNALFLSGGVNEIASLRSIELKRAGKTIATLDLYDLLLKGDISNDARLQDGDVIFIPTVEKLVGIQGGIQRPALYEIEGSTTVRQLLKLGGGLSDLAYPKQAKIIRNDVNGFKKQIDVDLTTEKGLLTAIKKGDLLEISQVIDQRESIVALSGHVHRPGERQWFKGIRVMDIFSDISIAKPSVDINYALLKRTHRPLGNIEVLFVDLGAVLTNNQSSYNYLLEPLDELMVFSNVDEGRAETLALTVEQLKAQATINKLALVTTIHGEVRFPGEYPLTENMSINQLIRAAGGLREGAYQVEGEISRYDFSNPQSSDIEHFKFALTAPKENDESRLKPYDVVSIHRLPNFKEQLSITLNGEVKFPGTYIFKSGDTLRNVIQRAGGLTALAHPMAAVFTRADLLEREKEIIKKLQEQFKSDFAAAKLVKANEGESVNIDAESALETIDEGYAQGRLVINLEGILDGSVNDLQLKNGDVLSIPEYRQEITIAGEVQYPSAHSYAPSLTLKDYLELSGGMTRKADKRSVYVIKADGSVELPKKNIWGNNRNGKLLIEPGDAVVVPVHVSKKSGLSIISEISDITYRLILGAAVIAAL